MKELHYCHPVLYNATPAAIGGANVNFEIMAIAN
jgi:hypothetical protein